MNSLKRSARASSRGPILAVDPASSTGWAVGDGHSPIISGVWLLKPEALRLLAASGGKAHPGYMYLALTERLTGVEDMFGPFERVVFEEAHHRGRAATEQHYGLTANLSAWAATRGSFAQGFHSATIKKQASGNGHAQKDVMIRAARGIFEYYNGTPGPHVLGDDEADAVCLLHVALSNRGVR